MPGLALILFGAFVPLGVAYALGRRLGQGEPVIRFALGAAILSQICFLLVSIGLPILVVILLALVLEAFRGVRPRVDPVHLYGGLLFAPLLVFYFVHALAPEIQADAISYHLGLVAGWRRDHDFWAQTGHFDVMPHGLELLFAPAFAIGGHSAAKLVHFAFLVATIPLFRSVGRALGLDGGSTLAAALLYLAAPVVAASGTCAYNDAALGFFCLAAFRLSLDGNDARTGIAAGFCYAIKMTGGVMLLYLLVRKKWKAAVAATVVMLPWMARAWWLTGNPLAPLFNGIFPNPFFHFSTEQQLKDYVGAYDAATSPLWREWTIGGANTQGLTGPAFLLLPIGLLALRSTAGRKLAAAAAIVALPAVFNVGTRFLIPALAFAAILLAMSLPRRLAWAVAAAQVLLCAPGVIHRWSDPDAWRLRGFPWRAALRIESGEDYLRRATEGYPVAEMIARRTGYKDRILDIAGLATAYIPRKVEPHWQYAGAERAADALGLAARSSRTSSYEAIAKWPAAPFRSLRIEQTASGPEHWSFQEIELLREGRAIFPSSTWILDASVNPWELPLAFDRNPASRWQTWEPRRGGMWIQFDFPAAIGLDGIRLVAPMGENNARYRIRGLRADGEWVTISDAPGRAYWEAISLRRHAGTFLRREGFTHLAIRTHGDGFGKVGRDIEARAADWGLELVEKRHGVYVYSQIDPTTQSR